ncbi:MAG: hypothetical protein AB7V44_13260 [Pseudonocardia sp.]
MSSYVMADGSTSQSDPFTEGAARAALTRACRLVDLSADGADLIHMGSNAVFRLGDVIGRVGPSIDLLGNAEK